MKIYKNISFEEKEKDYIEKEGEFCPHCDSDAISIHGSPDFDGIQATTPLICTNCGEKWTNVYVLVGIKSS